MTEQQIDAELCRYEPDFDGLDFGWARFPAGHDPRHQVPAAAFDRMRPRSPGRRWRYYPTREAAFADLRRAIAARGTNAGS